LNAVIRAVVAHRVGSGHEFVGFLDGWRGVLDGRSVTLEPSQCEDLLARGGHHSRDLAHEPLQRGRWRRGRGKMLDEMEVEAVVAIAVTTPWGSPHRLAEFDVACVGVPKTIDNDLSGTEVTFGFDTAVQIATEAIDRLHTTAESHHRIHRLRGDGRHAGWIATHAGIAGGAAEILVPERPFDVEALCAPGSSAAASAAACRRSSWSPRSGPVAGPQAEAAELATASGTVDQFGHARLGGIGAWLAREIEERTGYECRETTSGTPSAAVRRRPLTGCWPRALAWRPPTHSTRAPSTSWWRSRAARSCASPSRSGWGRPRASTSTCSTGWRDPSSA